MNYHNLTYKFHKEVHGHKCPENWKMLENARSRQ